MHLFEGGDDSVPRLHLSLGADAPHGIFEDAPSLDSVDMKLADVFDNPKWEGIVCSPGPVVSISSTLIVGCGRLRH